VGAGFFMHGSATVSFLLMIPPSGIEGFRSFFPLAVVARVVKAKPGNIDVHDPPRFYWILFCFFSFTDKSLSTRVLLDAFLWSGLMCWDVGKNGITVAPSPIKLMTFVRQVHAN
jgi:hypothetical protein